MATKKDQEQKKGKSKKPTPSAKKVTAASRKRPSARTAKSAENNQTSPSFVADDQVLENPRVMPMPEGNRESGALQERSTSPELEQLLAHTKALGDINTNATKFFDNANTKLGRLDKLEGMAKSLSDHTSTLNSVDSKLGKLDKLESMSTSLSDHTSKLSSVDTKLGKLDKLDSVTTSLSDHASKLGSVDTKLNKLDKLESMATSLSEQTSKLGNVNARLSKLDKLEEMTTSLNDHTSKLANLDRLASVDIKLDKLNEPPLTSLGLNDQGEEVGKLQRNLLQLGFEIPAEEEADNARTFGIGTLNALLEFQAEHKLPASGVLDNITKSVLGRAIANGKKPPSIKGRIVSEQGIPLSGVKVRFYSRGFGASNSTKLGERNTDPKGYFTVPEVKIGPNLEVYVVKVDANGKETEIKLARTRFNPATHEVLNLVAPSDMMMRESEYQRLSEGLKSHLPSNRTNHMMALTDAREQAENQTQSTRQDLTVLSRATGWDARLIALAALAARLTNEVGLTQEVFYGLLRAGLPSDKLLLAQVSKEVVEQALKKMRDAEIIKFTDDEIGQFKQQFATFANSVRLNVCAPGSRSTYDELLKGSGLLEDAQATFADVYLNHRGDADELWRKAAESKTITPEVIQTLKRQGKLAFLAGNSEKMVTRLMKKFTEQKIADPVQLVEKGFYHPDAWSSEVFDQAGIPQNRRNNLTDDDKIKLDELIPTAYFGENLEDRLDAYAKDMARKIKRSYPTHVIGHMIQQDHENEFKLGASRDATAQLVQSAATQGFRLGQTPVELFLKTHTGVRETMSDVAEEDFQMAKQQLKTLQRVYQLTPSTEAMTVLLGQGLTSAYDILSLSKDTFLKIHGSSFSSLDQARLVYQKAQQVSSVTYNLFSIVKKLDSELPIFGMSASPEVRKSVRDELIKQFPTMESLFGSMDYCECEHCRSVLSPAAYLVDLLQFLDPDEPAWNGFREDWKEGHNEENYPFGKPYEVLIERRPDLPNIQLTCENTNTAMPYIDIVNEILEYYVAKGKLEESAAHDTGDATSAELLAEPQNVIREAYDKLREARYPLNLPFDLWIETVRQFCNYFEMPLDRVLTAFRPSDNLFASAQTFDRFGIFMESLELLPAELDIFTDPDPLNNWHKLYGYETADKAKTVVTDPITGQRVDLNSAKTLSRRLGVTYKDIVEIIQTEFVNPELTKLTLLSKLGVTIQDTWFYLNANHRYLYEQNKDLIGKSREDLSPEDQKRFDNLSRKFGKYIRVGKLFMKLRHLNNG